MNLSKLLALVDTYHITDKRLLRARAAVERKPGQASEREFCRQAGRYFRALAREAEVHLTQVDRRLDDLYQRQYNLQAERAVAERRLDGAQTVVKALNDAQP